MKDVEAKKRGTDDLLEEMGAQRSEAEAQQVNAVNSRHRRGTATAFCTHYLEESMYFIPFKINLGR